MAVNPRGKKGPVGGGGTLPPRGTGGGGGEPPERSETDKLLAEGRRIPVAVAGDFREDPLRIAGPAPDGSFRVNGPAPDGSFPVSGPGPDGTFPVAANGPLSVNLQRSASDPTTDQPLWVAIRWGTRAIGFDNYDRFIQRVLCDEDNVPQRVRFRREGADLLHGVDAYQLLRTATEAFLLVNCGVAIDPAYYERFRDDPLRENEFREFQVEETSRLGGGLSEADFLDRLTRDLRAYLGLNGTLPYIDRIARGFLGGQESPFCDTNIPEKMLAPCLLELIWSYWHEEGMLVQAINTISLRFQNKRGPGDREPLSNFEIHPLRPLTNLLWGYIQDEDHRLTVARRAYEYEHHYGIGLIGKAAPTLRPADRRSKFLEAFHGLLQQAALFYERDANTTVIADGFPLLNSLREVHILLAEGAHNQFRDLPWTARVEMLVQQWLLARPEMREFLGGRAMVPYAEPWMGQVDALKRLQGWNDTPVNHFHDLAIHGEQILLSIRYGDWSVENNQDRARNWVRYWRPEIQRYIHAYQAVTGIDLAATSQDRQAGLRINATPPSVLLQQRAARQRVR
ncbi:MAG TPA: hypothetical protein VL025_09970 [Thermoanaerobaculia bacterium]|nr:hypothetical protein [Thermoanaerobaculia bacterium]